MTVTSCSHEKILFTKKTRDAMIRKAVAILKTWTKDFDAIAISGYSSAMTASIVASLLNKNIVLVRKPSEVRHSDFNSEGQHEQRVLFFDDVISSGETLKRVIDGMVNIQCKVVGFYLYQSSSPAEVINDIAPNIISMQKPKRARNRRHSNDVKLITAKEKGERK